MEGIGRKNRKIGGSRTHEGAGQSQSSNSNYVTSLSSVDGRPVDVPRGRKCGCRVRTILMTAKTGRYAGRKFWRCPFWMMSTSCGMFIWADEEEAIFGNDEVDECKGDIESDAVHYVLQEIEDVKKKAEHLEVKFKVERKRVKIVVLILVCSLAMNLASVMKREG